MLTQWAHSGSVALPYRMFAERLACLSPLPKLTLRTYRFFNLAATLNNNLSKLCYFHMYHSTLNDMFVLTKHLNKDILFSHVHKNHMNALIYLANRYLSHFWLQYNLLYQFDFITYCCLCTLNILRNFFKSTLNNLKNINFTLFIYITYLEIQNYNLNIIFIIYNTLHTIFV